MPSPLDEGITLPPRLGILKHPITRTILPINFPLAQNSTSTQFTRAFCLTFVKLKIERALRLFLHKASVRRRSAPRLNDFAVNRRRQDRFWFKSSVRDAKCQVTQVSWPGRQAIIFFNAMLINLWFLCKDNCFTENWDNIDFEFFGIVIVWLFIYYNT